VPFSHRKLWQALEEWTFLRGGNRKEGGRRGDGRKKLGLRTVLLGSGLGKGNYGRRLSKKRHGRLHARRSDQQNAGWISYAWGARRNVGLSIREKLLKTYPYNGGAGGMNMMKELAELEGPGGKKGDKRYNKRGSPTDNGEDSQRTKTQPEDGSAQGVRL